MKPLLILLGIINLAIAFVLPALGKAHYAATVGQIISTYDRLGDDNGSPTYSAAESHLFKSIEQRSFIRTMPLAALFAGQGVILVTLGIILKKPAASATKAGVQSC